MIQLNIIGHLGKDAEVRTQPDGSQAINFSVAHTKKWTTAQGEEKSKTTWVDIVIWKKAGESTAVAQYLKKGTQVYVTGEPDVRAYVNNQQQAQGNITMSVTGYGLQLLGGGQQQGAQANPQAAAQYGYGAPAAAAAPQSYGYGAQQPAAAQPMQAAPQYGYGQTTPPPAAPGGFIPAETFDGLPF